MSPRTALQNQTLRVRSEEKILEVALRLFSQHGFEGASVRMIAREAGISLGLMYNYFESKEVLLIALFMKYRAPVQDSLAPEGSGDSLSTITLPLARSLRQQEAFWRLWYSLRLQPQASHTLGPLLHGMLEPLRMNLEALCQRLHHPRPATQARILLATLEGVSQQFLAEPATFPLDAMLQSLTIHL